MNLLTKLIILYKIQGIRLTCCLFNIFKRNIFRVVSFISLINKRKLLNILFNIAIK